jgi:hypothetical protein
MMVSQNRQTKENYKKLLSKSEIESCSAKGNGDMDDDVCLKIFD